MKGPQLIRLKDMIDLATNFNYKPTLVSMEQRVCNQSRPDTI